MLVGRYVNLILPIQFKKVIDALGTDGGIPFTEILAFVFIRFLAGSSGILGNIQAWLWIPVGQFTTREISVQMLRHLHNLSLRFHLNRKTGEILRVQDRGVASIVSLLNSILFNIIPTVADIIIACIFFVLNFDAIFGSIVFVTMISYLTCTVVLTEWRTQYRKRANELDNEMEAKAVDSLLNFETVKYFNAEEFEVFEYGNALRKYQAADLFSMMTLWLLDGIQNVIIQLGLLLGCLLCAQRILVDHTMTVGHFVLYLSYITQLYGPLNWFGNYYRTIQKNFVDMEKMLDLFKIKSEIVDCPDAVALHISMGHVIFDHVYFSYDLRKQTLNNISFEMKPGTITALVGTSGSGKSTIGRLLFRFYDVSSGSITIDGHDIRNVTQLSLRQAMGVVPQDTILFNDTIKYNISYANPGATDDQFFDATQSAQIHEKIMTFPDGYETKVGERGLRLSGGEKQRVAIARTLLKNPAILLLDEATSALDTHSETALQEALLLNKSRTTLVIAHRLSTIVHADQILVLNDGEIIERGKHSELIKLRKSYYGMWMKQLKDENGMVETMGS